MELVCDSLSKSYGVTKALREFSCTLTPGVYGLLGPNGAGKSTLMNILSGNLTQTSGRVLLDGQDIRSMGASYFSALGYMPQQQAMYPRFTCAQFLGYMAALKAIQKPDIAGALSQVELLQEANKRVASLSGGMKQRLLLAQTLLGQPRILLLDEPTAGLDPRQRITVRNLIASVAENKVVLICTHVVQDVEYIAKEILLLKQGVLLEKAAPQAMLHAMQGKVRELVTDREGMQALTGPIAGVAAGENGLLHLRVISEEPLGEPVRPTLEDVYLYHFGHDTI